MAIVILTIVGFFHRTLSMTLGLSINGVCLVLACLSWFLDKNAKDTDIATPIMKVFFIRHTYDFQYRKVYTWKWYFIYSSELSIRTMLIAFIVLKWIANKIDNLMH